MKQIHEIKPYTYLVKFKPTGKVYYGSRCQNYTKFNKTPADDFWHIYTTSSNTINDLIEEYGKDAFDYEIRRTFDTVEEMSAWETKVLKRCRVLERQDIWMNSNVAGKKILTEAGAKVISATHKDKPKTEEHKRNLSLSQKGKPKVNSKNQTPEYRALMSKLKSGEGNGRYGKEVSEETRQRISEAKKGKQVAHNKGVPMTEAQKQKLRDKMLGRKVDPEVIARRVKSQTGKTRTPEQRERIAEGIRKHHANKKLAK